ncbi:ComF family protein [Lederbergia graminis]|uniref:ComF family protein n=1 Tax=Lederbergia graminis TaxID=735518 RepID=A0ABW0LI58_9BACI
MNSHCLYCDSFIQGQVSWMTFLFPTDEPTLCSTCLRQLHVIEGKRCDICSRSLENLKTEYIEDNTCLDCIRWSKQGEVLEKNISLYHYNDFMKELMAKFKFRGDYELGKVFVPAIRKALKKMEYDMLVPIPLSRTRLKERGFNQAAAIGQLAGFEIYDVLERHHSEKQSKKTRRERLQQSSIFTLIRGEVSGKQILLIDDIYTTGTTLRHAAKTLKDAGAKNIQAITIAR